MWKTGGGGGSGRRFGSGAVDLVDVDALARGALRVKGMRNAPACEDSRVGRELFGVQDG